MHDLKLIREDFAAWRAGLARRTLSEEQRAEIETLPALDTEVRAARTEKEAAEAARNAASKAIGAAKAKKDEAEAARLMAEVEGAKAKIAEAGAREEAAEKKLRAILEALPNRPHPDVPDGADEEGNIEARRWWREMGAGPPNVDLSADHVTLGEALKLMDFEAAARISGARFVALKGQLAQLERALAAFMLDIQTQEHGYTEVSPPLLVDPHAAFGTGQLPKFREDLFLSLGVVDPELFRRGVARVDIAPLQLGDFTNISDLAPVLHAINAKLDEVNRNHEEMRAQILNWRPRYLIPTSEVSLTNLVREQILSEADLPIRMTADTPCFRAEAGSAGRDTRGMIRMHQFRKVELVSIVKPEDSRQEHERMTACAETILKRLELPFRTMLLCAGDMGFSAEKTYDLEVWLPSQGKYREISSCSNCGDFQARRMDARFRREGHKGTEFVHTLNGSGLAVGRTLVAVMENYQQADGSIAIPTALQPYMNYATQIG